MNQRGFTLKEPWSGKVAHAWERYDSFSARWDQICQSLKINKQLINSLTQADWIARMTSTPRAEIKVRTLKSICRHEEGQLGRMVKSFEKTDD
ncbi:hypothetical protein RB213_006285 [Colletotrichum asianum]